MQDSETARLGRGDCAIVVLFVMLTGVFAGMAVRQYGWARETRRLAAVGRYNACPAEVMGNEPHIRGWAGAQFTLVEFGDYQCGPCRAAAPKVRALLRRHERDLSFVFRDLPLTSIHPLAMNAAVLANRAGNAVDYWATHDLLYSDGIDGALLRRAEANLEKTGRPALPESGATDRVSQSIRAARSLGIGGTPAYVLLCPGSIVRRVGALEDVENLLAARPAPRLGVGQDEENAH
ncbi:MAG: thioredoxin domain-containing protein [Armatimonadetes bacterium]|jgi:hypothetical protein|nr:thioredoxin domain-containing protein [Armatimonadota bacterium]